MDFTYKSALIGLTGDFLLQIITKNQKTDKWGLKHYFEIHGPIESLCIATGLMWVAAAFYQNVGFDVNSYITLFIYGGIIDVLFRTLNIMPSLIGYYTTNNPILTFIWGGIPMILIRLL